MTAGFSRAFNQKVINVLDCADGVRIDRYVVGGTIVDSAPAFTEALRRARALGGATIYMPRGNYYCSHEVENDGPNHWKGDGAGGFYFGGTQVYFPAGVHGFINQSEHLSSTQGSGEWATFSDFSILALGKTAGTWKHGLKVHRSCDVTRVHVGFDSGPYSHGFSGNGVHVIGATDTNVLDTRQFWKTATAYTVGDIVRAVGTPRSLMAATAGNISLAASGDTKGTVVITRTVAWTTTPSDYDLISIEAGSDIAGAGNANVGLYFCDPNLASPSATSTTITCRKISDSPYLVTGFYTEPVTVAVVANTTISTTKCYPQSTDVFACIASGTSTTEPTGTDPDAVVTDGASGPSWRYFTQLGACNDMQITSVRSVKHDGSGLYVEGYDSNQIRTYGFSSVLCDGYGIWDNSFIGCTHIGPHTADNVTGAYRNAFHGNSRSALVNPYAESSQGIGILWFAPGQVIGGIHGAGSEVSTESTALVIRGGDFSTHTTTGTQSGKKIVATTPRVSGGAGLFAGFGFERLNSDNSSTEGSGGQALLMGQWQALNGTTPEAWVARLSNYDQSGIQFTTADHAGRVEIRSLSVTAGAGSGGVGQFPGSLIGAAYGSPQGALGGAFRPGDLILDQHRSAEQAALYVANVKCGFGSGWAVSTVYYEGATVVPVSVPGTVFRRHSSSTAYTSAGSEPNWASAPAITNTVTNGDGIVWENWGPTQTGFDAIYSFGAGADDKTTVGAITQNTRKGLANIQPGAAARVVTNSLVTATSIIGVSLQFVDATLTQILTCVPAAGSFTVTGNANATAVTKFAWWIIE